MNHFTPFLGKSPTASRLPTEAVALALLCAVQFGCGLTVGLVLGGWPSSSSETLGIRGNAGATEAGQLRIDGVEKF